MAIRIPQAIGSQGNLVPAVTVNPDQRDEYSCPKCKTKLSFTQAHTKQEGDDPVRVPPYFKLWPKHRHLATCPYDLKGQICTIARKAKDSKGYLDKPKGSEKYRFRLLALPVFGSADEDKNPAHPPNPNKTSKNREFALSKETLPPYLSTAKRILRLRTLCDENEEIEEHLVFTFGDKSVPWADVYFEKGGYPRALEIEVGPDPKHPIALVGVVENKFEMVGDEYTTYTINLMPYRKRQSDGTVLTVRPCIRTSRDFFFNDIEVGDVVVAFGHWWHKAYPKMVEGTTFTNDCLYLRPLRKDQVAKKPKLE